MRADEEHHRPAKFESRGQAAAVLLQTDMHASSAPVNATCDGTPRAREVRVEGESVLARHQPYKSEHRGLPERPQAAYVDPAGTGTGLVLQVGGRGRAEILFSQLELAQARGGNSMQPPGSANCRARTAARSTQNWPCARVVGTRWVAAPATPRRRPV